MWHLKTVKPIDIENRLVLARGSGVEEMRGGWSRGTNSQIQIKSGDPL